MDSTTKLISAFQEYGRRTGLRPATVSTRVANDGKFYDGLLEGKGITMKRYEKIMRWFEENMPPSEAQP